MPKRPRDPVEHARHKLADAQLDLHLAQERRLVAISRGEREVRDAEARAARREQRATERVERRAGEVARAEARLYSVTEKLRRIQRERQEALQAQGQAGQDE
jgi:hypothetical protein